MNIYEMNIYEIRSGFGLGRRESLSYLSDDVPRNHLKILGTLYLIEPKPARYSSQQLYGADGIVVRLV
jgi:hypothetical protein